MSRQGITILGSTGSIGQSTLDVIGRHPDRFRVVALSGYRQVEQMFAQCHQYQPDYAVMVHQQAANQLAEMIRA
ncbi:MAG: 1-deoxy-D-xylulose-5-phosphate reductoisomerase, partial [Proteobacteria bacterium]|nr:1-deoxy-D-xylulose-5-phosphate reductoisomerase [Pseudomonadota bacterium]